MLGRGLPVGQHPLRRQRRVHPQWRRHGAPLFLLIAMCLANGQLLQASSCSGDCQTLDRYIMHTITVLSS